MQLTGSLSTFSANAAHWDFLPKFISIYFYSTPEGFLGVQRSKRNQGILI